MLNIKNPQLAWLCLLRVHVKYKDPTVSMVMLDPTVSMVMLDPTVSMVMLTKSSCLT